MDKAKAKIHKKMIKTKERTVDTDTGKTKVRLHFEEVDKPKPPSKLEHSIKRAPQRAVLSAVHKKISEDGQDKAYDCVAVLDDTAGQFVNFTMEFAAKKKGK